MTNYVVVLAGAAAEIFAAAKSETPMRVSDVCSSYDELKFVLQRAERAPKYGPSLVFPLSVAVDELWRKAFPLTRVYVHSAVPDEAATAPTFDDMNHAVMFGNATFDSAKLAAFVRRLPEGQTLVEVTAGHDEDRRNKIANILDLAVADVRFVPLHPSTQAYRIAMPMIADNNTVMRPFGTVYDKGSDRQQAPSVVMFYSDRAATHVAAWKTAEIGEIVTTHRIADSMSIRTPQFPSTLPRSGLFGVNAADVLAGREAKALADGIQRFIDMT